MRMGVINVSDISSGGENMTFEEVLRETQNRPVSCPGGEESMAFEDAISELERIVQALEKGELPIEESIEYFQRGVKLSKYCSKKLDEIEMKITMLIEEEDGNIREEVFALKEKDSINDEL